MEFIDEHPVFSIIPPIITTLRVYLITGAPSLLILGMLSSGAVVVIRFLPHENQSQASQEPVILDQLSAGKQYDYLRDLLVPLDCVPHLNAITLEVERRAARGLYC